MEFTQDQRDGKLVVTISGRLDAITAQELDTQCSKWLDQGQDKVVADLSGLEYISSAGLRSILAAGKRLKSAGGGLEFCCLSGMVLEVFNVSGFTGLFPMHDSVEEALAG